MTIYFLHPELTIDSTDNAIQFYEKCLEELLEHVDAVPLLKIRALRSTQLNNDDSIIFFNRCDQEYSEALISFFQDSCEYTVDVFPIAIDKDYRIPPQCFEKIQTFDIIENLRHRSLTKENLATVAYALARNVIAKLQPTLAKDRMRLFISHRRLDGEEIASSLCAELRKRSENTFRDLIDIHVGEDAQEIIESRLRNSDAVIFIDTPKSGESKWIAKEIQIALSMNLPIVWIKIGVSEGRKSLTVRPYDQPHYTFSDIDPLTGSFRPEMVDEFIRKAFHLSREQAIIVFDQIRKLRMLAKLHGIQLEEINRKNMLFRIQFPRAGFRYNQKPMTHLIQIFGRYPGPTDTEQIDPLVRSYGYDPHPLYGPYYDSTLLLAPIQGQEECAVLGEHNYVDSFDEYLYSMEKYLSIPKMNKTKKAVIISGAFPDCEPGYQQYLLNALHSFTQVFLDIGATVIFGGHPTFQHLIFDMAKRRRPKDYIESIKLYISKLYVPDILVEEMQKQSTVFAIDAENDRESSLTRMRENMINDADAVGLIVLGGKIHVGGHIPGVDEEIELAKKRKLPIFLIGSVGGRSSELATEYKNNAWKDINNGLSNQSNEQLLTSLDYRVLAKQVAEHLKL
ncbi:TIR domain-containing protein [Paenibacillus sp. FSL R7-0333]|uniref:TIR domain-containing protein n=1 Tax=Paenibacillus sp. FSL R7-0333 TaxID=1926587 RepID=UPI00096E348C|nr:hypothetical protein BK146_30340 [Paenibacillus sp. FSL R7-0333]